MSKRRRSVKDADNIVSSESSNQSEINGSPAFLLTQSAVNFTVPFTTTNTVTNTGAVTNTSTVTNNGAVTNTSTVTNTGPVTNSNTVTNNGAVTNTSPVTNTNTVTTSGNQTNTGTLTVSGADNLNKFKVIGNDVADVFEVSTTVNSRGILINGAGITQTTNRPVDVRHVEAASLLGNTWIGCGNSGAGAATRFNLIDADTGTSVGVRYNVTGFTSSWYNNFSVGGNVIYGFNASELRVGRTGANIDFEVIDTVGDAVFFVDTSLDQVQASNLYVQTGTGAYVNLGANATALSASNHLQNFGGDLYWGLGKLNSNVAASGGTTTLTVQDVYRVTSTPSTVTLPAATSCPGRIVTIVNIGTNTTTIQRAGSDTIDDAVTTSIQIVADREHVSLRSDGTSLWMVV